MLDLAWKNMWVHRVRTVLTILGIRCWVRAGHPDGPDLSSAGENPLMAVVQIPGVGRFLDRYLV